MLPQLMQYSLVDVVVVLKNCEDGMTLIRRENGLYVEVVDAMNAFFLRLQVLVVS